MALRYKGLEWPWLLQRALLLVNSRVQQPWPLVLLLVSTSWHQGLLHHWLLSKQA